MVGDGDRQLHDVAAVQPRVRVVRLDHVAEQECRATVCIPQLELIVDAYAPLAGEHRQEGDQRHCKEHTCGRLHAREGDCEPDRRQARIDHVHG